VGAIMWGWYSLVIQLPPSFPMMAKYFIKKTKIEKERKKKNEFLGCNICVREPG
jgi:hypothetical protein